MSINYTEKRNFIRMKTDSKITVKPQGSQQTLEGQCIDLSAVGVLFSISQQFNPGTQLDINITPEHSISPALDATIEVVRAQPQNNGSFDIAAEIKAIT